MEYPKPNRKKGNRYRLSNGETLTKAQIDARVHDAKLLKLHQFMEEHGGFYCEECGTSSDRLDCSHTVSVDKCQKMGKTEMAWNVSNIILRCRSCHKKHDKLT